MMDGLLRRDALLARLARNPPRIVALTAPAGFGKTTFALQYLEARGGVLVDTEGLTSELQAAQRLIEALAQAGQPAEALHQVARALADAGVSVAERLDRAIDAWRTAPHACIVFERADQLLRSGPTREFFGRLLAAAPPERTIVICSRDPLRAYVPRQLLAHEVVFLRAADLAFTRAEVQAFLAARDDQTALLDRIFARTYGWPIVLFALRRLAGDGGLAAPVERFDAPLFGELRDYLASEVVAHFDDDLTRTLLTVAALGEAHVEDLRAAFPGRDAAAALARDDRVSGLVALSRDGSVKVHPLLEALLLERRARERERIVQAVAAEHQRNGDFLRAAELHAGIGNRYDAARALGNHEIIADAQPPDRYTAVLAQLDAASAARYPRLWGVRALTRIFRTDSALLLDEAETIWRTLVPDATPLERYYVFVFRMLLMSYAGRLDEALDAIDRFFVESGAADPPMTLLDGHVLYLRGLLRARRGSFDLGERDLNAALPYVDRTDQVAADIYLALGADIARVRGEWSVERQFLSRARERVAGVRLPNFGALVSAEVLIGAWFAGERQAFNDAAHALDAAVSAEGITGFAYLAAVARGRRVEPKPADLPKYVIFAELIGLSRSNDEAERAGLARDALERAQRLRMPFVEALASIALGLCEPEKFDRAAGLARAAASRCDAPAFAHAINAFASGHENVGMLATFVAQIARDRSESAPVALEVLTGRVQVEGAPVRLSLREFELLAALAQRREATTRARLAAMLWPDLDEFAARNALSVCLHRLRAHLGRNDAVERDADGYRLHADAFVDLWEIDRAASILRARDRLRENDRAALTRAFERLREERSGAIERWEWFESALHRLDDLRAQCAHRLAADALDRGDPDAALRFAEAAIDADPCDEPARELAVRAHLALGDRAAALRQYRQYREVLRVELGTEPSALLTALVMNA
jgi:DNA-binding SARP family transcriptional activator